MGSPVSEYAFVARLSAMEQGFLDSYSKNALPSVTVQSGSLQKVENAFKHLLGVEFISTDIEAIRSVLSGSAVELLVKDKVINRRPHCLLASACLLGLSGVSAHVLFVDDQIAEARFSMLRTVAASLNLRVSLITASSSSADRAAAYATDIVFLSAKERALDYLRDNLNSREKIDSIDGELQFLKRLEQQKNIRQFSQHNNATTVGLFEDIDLILSEGAMTPVHLYGESSNSTQDPKTEETIIAASNFFRVFSTYGRLGGLGELLDDSTANSFAHYPFVQHHIDGVAKSPQGVVRAQENTVRSRLQIYPATHTANEHVATVVESLLAQGNTVIVERIPPEVIESIQKVLLQRGSNAAVGDLDGIYQLALGTQQGTCLLMPFSLSRIPDKVSEGVFATDQSVAVLSFSSEESFRAEKRKRSRMQDLFADVRFHILVADHYAEAGVPAAVAKLLNLLPMMLRKLVVGALIRHKQKESDRHRARTISSLIKYEKELDDLLAFSG